MNVNLPDDKWKAFCSDVLDVKYITGSNISKRDLASPDESPNDYVELKLLLSYNPERVQRGKAPYVEILEDDQGRRYANLTVEGADYCKANNMLSVQQRKWGKIPASAVVDTYRTIEERLDKELVTTQASKNVKDGRFLFLQNKVLQDICIN